ncbi:MAG: hypothetical protein IPM60_16415 [Rhodospirillales bacterium]|nr:hypothetical protein [Rhodospirillales bacterium]
MKRLHKTRVATAALAVLPALAVAGVAGIAGAGQLIELTQTGCQFLEPENGTDHGFETASAADCDRINAETSVERLANADVMTVKPGTYTFRVTNKNVPYELGFWLRDSDYEAGNPLHKLTKTSVSGGGLVEGASRDYEVDLKPGTYLYSCPLNPTPDYTLVVSSE